MSQHRGLVVVGLPILGSIPKRVSEDITAGIRDLTYCVFFKVSGQGIAIEFTEEPIDYIGKIGI